MTTTEDELPAIKVLGVRVHMVQMPQVLAVMESWIENKTHCHSIIASGMHGVMEARRDPEFKTIANEADLFVADGYSLAWIGRRRRHSMRRRVSGPDLMREFLKASEETGHRSFFYGDTEETLARLTSKLAVEFPSLQIAGAYSPPFRELTEEEDQEIVRLVNASGAVVVWVGLGLPKQERWIHQHKGQLDASVAVGVGAAFKFLGGSVGRAPAWMGNYGLEWLWRFGQEPKRMWRRVLFDIPRFIGLSFLELSGLRKYD